MASARCSARETVAQRRLATALDRPPEVEDHEVSWSLYFSDPDGNPYEITCYEYAELASALG